MQKKSIWAILEKIFDHLDFNMKYCDNNIVVNNQHCTYNSTQWIKPESSATNARMCTGSGLTYEVTRERANQLYNH